MPHVYSQFNPTGYQYQRELKAPAPQPAKQGLVKRTLIRLGLVVNTDQVATAQRAGGSTYTANAPDVVSSRGLIGLQTGASAIKNGRATDAQLQDILSSLGRELGT